MKLSELIDFLSKLDQDMHIKLDTPINSTYHFKYDNIEEILDSKHVFKRTENLNLRIAFPENVIELKAQVDFHNQKISS